MFSTAPWAITRATTPMQLSWRQGAQSALNQVRIKRLASLGAWHWRVDCATGGRGQGQI
jgi:hypothetical protein